MEPIRVLLAVDAPEIAESIIDYLDRSGQARVVATANDEGQIVSAVRQVSPDVVLASTAVLGAITAAGPPIVVVDTQVSTGDLRSVIARGAAAFILWPDERDQLLRAIGRFRPQAGPLPIGGGCVTAVIGARGGSGATFVATHVADALARSQTGQRVALVDADLFGAGAAVVLGAARVEGTKTIQELLPVLDELDPGHLDEVMWEHPRGFRVALPPRSSVVAAEMSTEAISTIVRVASRGSDQVIVDLPRIPGVAMPILSMANRVIVVLPLDVTAFAQATRLREVLGEDDVDYVINLAARSPITAQDVPRVFGVPATGVVAYDRRVRAAQDRGQLLSPRSKIAREFDRIVGTIPESRKSAA